jgi:3-ketosteroid 9alpha-monooxygenase subunit A
LYEHGWFGLGFDGEVPAGSGGPLRRARVGRRRLLVLDGPAGPRAFGADCPHRGADLALGRLDGDCVVCAFHGYRVRLGAGTGGDLVADELPVLRAAGLVFVRLSGSHENGLADHLRCLSERHAFVPCLEMAVRAAPETVIENGFDQRHFDAVHGIGTSQFAVAVDGNGALVATGAFAVPAVGRYGSGTSGTGTNGGTGTSTGQATSTLGYRATAFSPGVIAVELTGPNPYTVITTATPGDDGTTVIRLVLAVPADDGAAPDESAYRYLVEHSRRGLEQDRAVWESLNPHAPQRLTAADEPVTAFHRFCAGFGPSPTPNP